MKRMLLALSCILTALLCARAEAADIPAIADTNTDTAAPTTNFGSNGIVALSSARTVLMRFDQAKIEQAVGGHALLKIKVLVAKNATNGVALQFVNGPWNEKTVTAATLPQLLPIPDAQKIITRADVGNVVTFDVSNAFATWKSNPARNFGLALVGASPAPNLSLGSREGGNPATITTSGPATDNDVTVAPTGGDYPGLLEAVDNMTNGDRWCTSISDESPCVIHMAAGIYPIVGRRVDTFAPLRIVGAQRGETIIISKLDGKDYTAFFLGDTLELNDLTLVGDAMCIQGGNIILKRVVLRCERLFDIESSGFDVTDSDLTAISDGEMDAITLDGTGGLQSLTRTSVTAISRQSFVTMISEFDSPTSIELNFTDSRLSAWGKLSGLIYSSGDEFNRGITLLRTSVDSSGPNGTGGFGGEGFGFTMLDSHINAHGLVGSGLGYEGRGVIIDNSTIDATSTAVGIEPHPFQGPNASGDVTILRSQIHGGNTGLFLEHSTAHVESSVVQGPTVAALNDFSSLSAETSQLAGTITKGEGATASCDQVLDGNLQTRPANCTGP
jgi:hypothetical protein